jgi:hypothetical protein
MSSNTENATEGGTFNKPKIIASIEGHRIRHPEEPERMQGIAIAIPRNP